MSFDVKTILSPVMPTASHSVSSAAEEHRARRSLEGRWEPLALVGLCLAAFALRLPYLVEIPRFTDELQEILWALGIARGEMLPLTAV